MKKRVITLYLAALVVSAGAGSFETEDLFSIALPKGWVRMPDDVLVSYAEAAAETASEEPAQVYDYGFQLSSSEEWFSYPCILVQVKNIGRFSTGDLERFAESTEGSTSQLNDDKSLIIEVHERDGIDVLVGRQLTEYGYIELSGFAPADTFSEYEGVFREAFSNLKLDDRILYKPRITDNAPVIGNINLGKVFLVCLQAAVVGGVLWLIYGLLKRLLKRKDAVQNA